MFVNFPNMAFFFGGHINMSNNPLPPNPRQKYSYAALKTLEVGESVVFPIDAYDSLGPAIHRRWRLDRKKFVRRTEGDQIRVWRIA
jgi:hypothetical protein